MINDYYTYPALSYDLCLTNIRSRPILKITRVLHWLAWQSWIYGFWKFALSTKKYDIHGNSNISYNLYMNWMHQVHKNKSFFVINMQGTNNGWVGSCVAGSLETRAFSVWDWALQSRRDSRYAVNVWRSKRRWL